MQAYQQKMEKFFVSEEKSLVGLTQCSSDIHGFGTHKTFQYQYTCEYTECFTDLGKLNLLIVVRF